MANICKIKNCGKKYYAKRYCYIHYRNILFYPTHKELYSKWHRKYYLKTRILTKHKCKAKNCIRQIINKYDYCFRHRQRIMRHLSLNLSIKYSPKGKRNYMWRGGVAMYPNHYLMKKNRLIILMQNPICEICKKKPATQIHHKDGSKTNHSLSNLQALCRKCHYKTFSKVYKTKYTKMYGKNLTQLAKELKKPMTTIYGWHKKNKLKEKLNVCIPSN